MTACGRIFSRELDSIVAISRQRSVLWAWAVLILSWVGAAAAGQPAAAAGEPAAAAADKLPAATPAAEAPAAPEVETSHPELGPAIELFRANKTGEALKALRELAAKDADLPPPMVVLAELYARSGQLNMAKLAYERAVVEAPKDPQAYQALGAFAVNEGSIAAGNLLLERALELLDSLAKNSLRHGPLELQILLGLSAVAEARQDWPAAQKRLETCLEKNPDDLSLRQRLGRVLWARQQPQQALAQFKLVAKVDKQFLPEASLAMLYQSSGSHAEAARWMAEALKARPLDPHTQVAAGQWAIQAGEYEQARDHAQAAIQLAPDLLDAKLLRGLVALFGADYPVAQHYFELALKQAPRDFAASNNLALALAQQDEEDKRKQALDYAQVNVQRFPRQAEAFATLGWALYRLGRLDAAEQALHSAASLGRVEPDTAYYMARVALDRHQTAQARQLLEAAMGMHAPAMTRAAAGELLEKLKSAEQPVPGPPQP